ncbi:MULTISPECIES: EscU/YscU/HrcU family type III secretion system export apparatus switch protein [Shewanella]|uniref:EscU/YscU/HrcU family type III secretion system export apparatus switch protein n=1 Tax=Shewanella TaxID=22 RepID=UPI001C656510|nr:MULTISPECIES: EscU/YscU/HrcU family type III secretion system export apparatus switch protein [Shewanella]QYJ95135.1 EscU/YscU/HrcU family type III secretion system export apparatus switch protein [Shewanella spartinae]QYJ98939.1 EscU/YscU/HrcU family type III secretion system export apparatus switch protein [Shewanella alkalitolerans]
MMNTYDDKPDDLQSSSDSKPHRPTQAAALRYDGKSAPQITAKGEDLVAEEIISIAKEAGIYIHQDANLSNFLQKLEIGEEIPKELYLLIAELIAFVYMLDGKFPERWDNMHKRIMQEV